jgi:hypothetical protein
MLIASAPNALQRAILLRSKQVSDLHRVLTFQRIL